VNTGGALHAPAGASDGTMPRDLVICSLEAWNDVWRRNQFLTDTLLRRHPALRVLFVEPPTDVLFDLAQRRRPTRPRITALRDDGRLHALRPLKPLSRRLGSLSDRLLRQQVVLAARRLGLTRPTLWVNDVTYVTLTRRTGWPTVYDVTDDWLLAPLPPREIARLRRLDEIALAQANEVVVCSPALATSRGRERPVTLVPNGVDVEHFRRPRPRPHDLPPAPTALYVGTLHDARLDIELVIELARSLPALSIVLVGPDALEAPARNRLSAEPNVHLLGSRPYADVPAYLQHADVVLVPHRVTPFTESLDPIKAYECLAVGRPTVATPVAGFRSLSEAVTVAPQESFVSAVRAALAAGATGPPSLLVPTWDERAADFEGALARAGSRSNHTDAGDL
jgi:glycosyltransferase involved in cell wall biosynthesis